MSKDFTHIIGGDTSVAPSSGDPLAEDLCQDGHEYELWSEKFRVKPFDTLYIDGKSFNEWALGLFPLVEGKEVTPENPTREDIEKNGTPVGNCWFYHRLLCKGRSLGIYGSGRWFGDCVFSEDVIIPILAKSRASCWMSLTPSEIFSQREGLRQAQGFCLVGGLGMGWFARRVAERKAVTKVVIVEKDQSIIDQFGNNFPKKVKIVCGDVWEYMEKQVAGALTFDSVLMDIWEGYGEAYDDEKYMELEDGHPNVWAWV